MKYLVMECANTYAVLLDEEGRFVKSANLGYEVGDTVLDPVIMRNQPLEKIKGTPRKMNRVVTTIVAIAAVITLFFGANFYQQNRVPYSSIFMAINPEVEMVLNKNGEILDIKGTNPDGQQLIENYERNSNDKSVVANELVDRAIEMGFLADGGRVSIAIDTPDQELFEQYGIELRRDLDGRISITIEITDLENRNQTPNEPAPETPVPDDDSGYDESSYEEPEEAPEPEPETPKTTAPKPAEPEKPKPKPVAPTPPKQSDDESDYEDTDYDNDDDDEDDDDTDYEDDDDEEDENDDD